jgi:hypothetical protein
MSFSRSQFPPGGWQFHQPATNWSAPTPKSSTFDQTVNLIIKHRLANGAIRVQHNLSVDPGVVGNELEAFTKARLGIQEPTPPKQEPPQPLAQAVAGVVAGLKNMAAGGALFLEWETEGLRPASAEQASSRASTCAQCPKNAPRDWASWFTESVAGMYRRKLERLHDLALSTPFDNELHVCAACNCPLRLKVHAPLPLILKHLTVDAKANLNRENPRCWILREGEL